MNTPSSDEKSTWCVVFGFDEEEKSIFQAARLMVNYPGMVSCDDETFHKAHLEERFFELLPTVPLKGLTVSSSMRRYKGQDDGHFHWVFFLE